MTTAKGVTASAMLETDESDSNKDNDTTNKTNRPKSESDNQKKTNDKDEGPKRDTELTLPQSGDRPQLLR